MYSTRKGVSIRKELDNSYKWTTSISIVIMFLCLILVVWLANDAKVGSRSSIPAVQYSEDIFVGIHESEELVNSKAVPDNDPKSEHKAIWEENIWPVVVELKKIAQDWNGRDQKMLTEVERQLHHLENIQIKAMTLKNNQNAKQLVDRQFATKDLTNETALIIEKINGALTLINTSQLIKIESRANSSKIFYWIIIMGLLVLMVISGVIARRNLKKSLDGIMAPTDNLLKAIQRIAKGDFTLDKNPVNEPQDELGIALREMTTNLVKNSERLTANEAKYRTVVETAPNSVVIMDADCRIQMFNQSAEILFQYRAEEVVGKKFDMLLSKEQRIKQESSLDKSETVKGIEIVGKNQKILARKKDGGLFYINLSVVETEVNDKTVFTAIMRDLTEETQRQEEIEQRARETEKQNWIKTSISSVYDATKGVQDIADLSSVLIRVICKQLNAAVGTFYLNQNLFVTESDELKLYGSYALKNRNELPDSFKFGEGLVGECALQVETIALTDVPEGYLEINSSVGKTRPKEITIIPIKHNEKLVGVMEFGAVQQFHAAQKEFLEEVSQSIGIIIKGVVERTKTEELSIEINNQMTAINRSNAAIEFDLDGKVLTANDIFLDFMGYTLDEIKGKHHKIFVNTAYSKSTAYKDFWKDLKRGMFKQGEFERKRKDNEPIWIQGSYNPILGVDGKPYKVLKVAVDVSEQKRQQMKTERLSIEINNQMMAINRSNVAVEFDMEGKVLKANDIFLKLMGYTLEEVKGKHHRMFVKNTYAKTGEYKEFWKGFQQGTFKQGEFERVGKDKNPIWIQASYNPILDVEGKPYKVLKIAVDITEQKEFQLEIQKQKEVVEAQEEELRVSNEELTKQANMLQASEEELRQQQEELEKANVLLEERAQQLEEQHLETVEKNSALEQAQAALIIKTDELEKSGKYKSEFLANMSHELRTPLNSVIILSKLLQGNKTKNLTEKQIEFAQIINKSGEDLLSLINEVLDLAKVESGKIELAIASHNLRSYAEDTKKTFVAQAEDKKVNFVLEVDESLPEHINTDKQRLNQVVKNLLSNAFKFTDADGTVTLEFAKRKALSKFTSSSLLKQEHVLQISVIDTGIGISNDKLDSIFEAFVQEDGTTQRKYGGTGLGLNISKELVKLLGGEIFVESELGKGSTFSIFLPLDAAEEIGKQNKTELAVQSVDYKESDHSIKKQKEETNDPVEPTVEQKTVGEKLEAVIADDRDQLQEGDKVLLIVEDDLQFAKILLDQARENDFKVLVTDQGDRALQHIETYLPNAVILDMQLPVMDGWTVLKKLKASKEFAHIPVHIMSGVDKTDLGLKMGAVEYLVKPITADKLEDTFSIISKNIDGGVLKKVLIVEDDEHNNRALQEMVNGKNLEPVSAKNASEARKLFQSKQPDLVVLDLGLPDKDGIELLGELKTMKKEVPIIVFTGRDLTSKELKQIERYKDTSVVLKTAKSYDRLSEETELFLNMLNQTQPEYAVLPPKEFNSEDIIKGKRILLVDDDMRNIYALETVLEEQQVDITVATNGAEAVEAVKNGEFDAVLMDIMMPVMDGYEATKKIRNMGHGKLPIIALTAKAMKGDREKCLEAGVSDYMSKPVDVEKLLSLLKVWLYN